MLFELKMIIITHEWTITHGKWNPRFIFQWIWTVYFYFKIVKWTLFLWGSRAIFCLKYVQILDHVKCLYMIIKENMGINLTIQFNESLLWKRIIMWTLKLIIASMWNPPKVVNICEGSLVNPIKKIFSPALRGFKMNILSISSV